jgi:curved DNA-binding protein CbpA
MNLSVDKGLFTFEIEDLHAILGLPLWATEQEIRARYREIARMLHPDSANWKSDTEKQAAEQLFSRSITHAYSTLSRASRRKEHEQILELVGKRLVAEASRIQLSCEAAQKFYRSPEASVEVQYRQIIEEYAGKQFIFPSQSPHAIGQLSEFNLVYLLHRQNQSVRTGSVSITPVNNNISVNNPASHDKEHSVANISLAATSVRRAEDYANMRNWGKVIVELREAIKLDPNHSPAHALLGMAYLKEQQLTMAKIHIKKALDLDPNDPTAKKAKQEYKAMSSANKTAELTQKNTAKVGAAAGAGKLFGGLFGGKK